MKDNHNNPKLNNLIAHISDEINRYAQEQIEHIDNLRNIGLAVSSEKDINRILEQIMRAAIYYTNADGASIYMVSEDGRFLDFKLVYNETLKIMLGGKGAILDWPSVPLYKDDGSRIQKNLAAFVYHSGKEMSFKDVYNQHQFDTSGTRSYDEHNKYHTRSVAAFPIKDHEGTVLGVIQLINARDENKKITHFTLEHITMLSSLTSLSATILTNRLLINNLEQLLSQFIKSIAKAIDRKSRFTGNHIHLVAMLSEELIRLINNSQEGKFARTTFSDDEIKELVLSAWMHDIGKIVTPENIINKSTKLEVIFDRIELIKQRISTIEIALNYEIKIAAEEKRSELQQLCNRIADYKKFLNHTNAGSEYLNDSDYAKLDEISKFRFNADGNELFIITEEEKQNLQIRKGTLLPEEFRIMRDHVVTTKEMLSELSFPKKYRNVPLYASSHHEKLNGKGYPDGLREEELPLCARIIPIADTYEALTAKDRPYKKGRMLSDSLKIMAFMAKDEEIDKDIFKLFLNSKLYLKYAREHVSTEQIDEINEEDLIKIFETQELK